MFKANIKNTRTTSVTLRHGCFPVNLLHIFRILFSRNTPGWLLLHPIIFHQELTLHWFLFSASNCNVSKIQNTSRQARTPSLFCGWGENEQNEIKTKSWEYFLGKEQMENLCSSSMQRKIQNQQTVVLDQIKTTKLMGNFVIMKLNKINIFLSLDSLIGIKNKELRMKLMRSNDFRAIFRHF